MNFEKFDKVLWRLLGSIILLGTLAGFFMVFSTFSSRSRRNGDVVVTQNKGSNIKKVALNFNRSAKLPHTDYMALYVSNRSNGELYSGGYYPGDANILLINHVTNEHFWLVENSESTVSATFIHEKEGKEGKVVGVLLQIAKSPEAPIDVKYFDLATKSHHPVVLGVHKFIDASLAKPGEMLVFYTTEKGASFTRFNLATFKAQDSGLGIPPL